MAPEYLCYGQVSSKLDVFSFGILLLEIVSGRKNIDLKSPSTEQYLVQWVSLQWISFFNVAMFTSMIFKLEMALKIFS